MKKTYRAELFYCTRFQYYSRAVSKIPPVHDVSEVLTISPDRQHRFHWAYKTCTARQLHTNACAYVIPNVLFLRAAGIGERSFSALIITVINEYRRDAPWPETLSPIALSFYSPNADVNVHCRSWRCCCWSFISNNYVFMFLMKNGKIPRAS